MHANAMDATWMRGVAAAAAVALAAMAGARPAAAPPQADLEQMPPDERGEAMQRIVLAQAQRLRDQLDALEGAQDYAPLLARKTTLECALLPMHLLRDAALLVHAPEVQAPDLFHALRVEYRDGPVRARWSDAAGAALVRRALAAWAPQAQEARVVSARVRTASQAWVEGDAPPLLQWTLCARWEASGPRIHARCWWHEPATIRDAIDFPLSPEGFDLWWNPDGARILDDRGAEHAEAWGAAAPVFANPPELFALLDGLRAVRAADAAVRSGPEAADAPAPGVPGAPETPGGAHASGVSPGAESAALRCVVREVEAADGRLLRRERWCFAGGRLRSLVVDQQPLKLVHQATQGFDLVTEVAGREVGRQEHRPGRTLVQHPGGLRIAVTFRPADPARDELPEGFGEADLPERIVVTEGAHARAWAEFESFSIAREERTPGAPALLAATARRRALADRVDDALARGDSSALAQALTELEAQQEADAVPAQWRAMALEGVTTRARSMGAHATAESVAASRWAPALAALGEPALEAARRRLRAAQQEDLARMLEGVGAAAAGPGAAAPCDPATLAAPVRRLLEESLAVVAVAAAIDGRVRAPLAAALCMECAQADPPLAAQASDSIPLATELQDFLAHGPARADAEAVAEEGAELVAARLAREWIAAAHRPAIAPPERARLRQLALQCAEAAAQVAADALVDAGWDTARARAVARQVRGECDRLLPLVGNRFVPGWCIPATAPAPDAAQWRARLEAGTSIGVLARRHAARAAVIGRIVSSEMGDVRAEAAQREIAQRTAEEALACLAQWLAAQPPEPVAHRGSSASAEAGRPASAPAVRISPAPACEQQPAGPVRFAAEAADVAGSEAPQPQLAMRDRRMRQGRRQPHGARSRGDSRGAGCGSSVCAAAVPVVRPQCSSGAPAG
jgi:hypothetical protein